MCALDGIRNNVFASYSLIGVIVIFQRSYFDYSHYRYSDNLKCFGTDLSLFDSNVMFLVKKNTLPTKKNES